MIGLIITIDHPPVNALSHAVRTGIVDALNTVDAAIDSVILHCAGRTFFSGADISEFGKPPQAPSLADVIIALEQCPVPDHRSHPRASARRRARTRHGV